MRASGVIPGERPLGPLLIHEEDEWRPLVVDETGTVLRAARWLLTTPLDDR
jgi:hypothetical protein